MAVTKLAVAFRENTIKEITRRYHSEGERSQTINQSLDRYFDLMSRGRRELRQIFEDKEIALILDALNGTGFFDAFSIYLIEHEIADAIAMDNLDQKWGVDGSGVINKMQQLSPGQKLALVDAVEIWWDRVASGEQPEFGEALKQ